MSEAERAEIIRQWYGGGSFRGIARALGMNRKTVAAVIKAHKDKRAQPHLSVPAPASQRKSLLGDVLRFLSKKNDVWFPKLHLPKYQSFLELLEQSLTR